MPAELLDNPQINKALEEVEISAFTEEELRAYDKFWDSVRTEKSMLYDSRQKGIEEGVEKGRAEGRAEGMAKGRAEERLATAKRLLDMGLSAEQVAQGSDLPLNEVMKLIEQ